MQVIQDNGTPVPWCPGDAARAIGLVFGGFLVVLLVARVTTFTGNGNSSSLTPWMVGLTDGLMLLAIWIFGIRKYRVSWEAVGLRRSLAGNRLGLSAAVLVGSLAFGMVYTATVSAFGLDVLKPVPISGDLLGHGMTRVLNAGVIIFLGPFTEELFFRGFVFTALIIPMGALRAVLISAIVFALAHLSFATMVPIFVTGLLMSWLYLKSGSVWPPITVHVAQNLIAVLLLV